MLKLNYVLFKILKYKILCLYFCAEKVNLYVDVFNYCFIILIFGGRMKNHIYALVSGKEIVVCVNGEGARKIKFDYTHYSDFEEYVAAVIYDSIKSLNLESVYLSLILGQTYYHLGHQYLTKVKTKNAESYRLRNYSYPVSSEHDDGNTLYFEQHADFEYDGKSCERLEDVPLLHKYIKRKSFMNWDFKKIESLSSHISKFGIEIMEIVPDVHFYNTISKNYWGNNVIVNFFDSHSEVAIFENGRVRSIDNLNFGISDLVSHISNVFGVSYRSGYVLTSMYGFANVPSQYVHYEISVPIYNEVVRTVKITDISYEIQSVLKKQFSQLCSEFKKFDAENVVIVGMPVVDADVLLQMISNCNCNFVGEITYAMIDASVEMLKKSSYSKIIESESNKETNEVCVSEDCKSKIEEKKDKFDIKNKFGNLLDKIRESKTRIEAMMVEAD